LTFGRPHIYFSRTPAPTPKCNHLPGRTAHLLAVGAAAALALALAGVAAHVGSGGADAVGAGYRSCTPTQSPALDPLLAAVSGTSALLAVLVLFVYPAMRERRQRRQRQQQDGGGALVEPLLEGGGVMSDVVTATAVAGVPGQQRQQRQRLLPSRRLKLLVAFSCLTMLVQTGRCLLQLSR
jgi:membrane protein implicated in regulation of membrane protease activity